MSDMCLEQELILRIIVGGLLGGVIGFERELRAKEAGFRTHFLVALGSALLSVVSAYGYDKILDLFPRASYDPGRITAQIVSGIGFIGAGLIIFQKNSVHGLTTAAGLWVTSGIGIACGIGHYDFAIVTTIMVLIALELVMLIDQRINKRMFTVTLKTGDRSKIDKFMSGIKEDKIHIRAYELNLDYEDGRKSYTAILELSTKRNQYEERLWELMDGMEGRLSEHIK